MCEMFFDPPVDYSLSTAYEQKSYSYFEIVNIVERNIFKDLFVFAIYLYLANIFSIGDLFLIITIHHISCCIVILKPLLPAA